MADLIPVMPAQAGIHDFSSHNAALLKLLTWLSPAFPTGGFAYSHGLEWSVDAGDVTDEPALIIWMQDTLSHGALWADAILLRHAYRKPDDLAALGELATALSPTPERRLETLAQGAAFCAAAAPWAALDAMPYPVAVGTLAAAHDVPEDDAALAYLHAAAANMVSAALRLIPLGQAAGLRAQAALEPAILATAALTAAATLDDLGTANWRAEIAAMHHETQYTRLFRHMRSSNGPLRVGIGGPVGTGKTALMDALCKTFRDRIEIAAITNDIYTKEDAEFLTRAGSLSPDRILGIETGGCPHTAIREDASINLAGIAQLCAKFPLLDLLLIESGGDNLAATFSPELADLTIYVIDVSAGDKIPRKGGPGITKSDLLVINKIDLAPHVGASLEVMDRDAKRMRGERPFIFANIRAGVGVPEIAAFVTKAGGL